nr:ribonuclease H-like domain, reverse transcriptase, RNA-dependent DNA polymerase [Tanacetum cinerariifolium]
MLKQEFSEFRISEAEGLQTGYDRMQKILSQLNQLDAKPDAEKINLSATGTSKMMPYGESPISSSPTTYSVSSISKTGSHKSSNVIEDVLHSFVADTEPEQQLAYEDLKQIDKLNLEEMDLKWQTAMLSVRVHKFKQKAGRKIDFDKKESARFNKQKVRCYKCQQRGHFARECRLKGGNDKQRYSSFKNKEIGKREEGSKALVSIDTLVDWSNHDSECDEVIAAKEFGMIAGYDSTDAIKAGSNKLYNMINGANSEEANTPSDAGEFALMGVTSEWKTSSKILYKLIDSSMFVRTKVGLRFTDCISQNELGWDDSDFSVFTTTSEDVEGRPTFHRFAKTDSMKVMPPPLTGDYTSLSDHSDLDESQMSYGTKSSTTCDPKSVPNDSVSCDDSNKSSEDNTNDLAFSDSGLKSSEYKSTDSSCASTSSVSTSMNGAEIDSNAKPVPTGTPKATPVPTGKPKGTPVPTGKPTVHRVPTGQPKFTPVPTGWLQRPFPVATDRGCSPSVPSEFKYADAVFYEEFLLICTDFSAYTFQDSILKKVIKNGNNLKRTGRGTYGALIFLPPATAEEHLAVQRESKARTTLLQSIPGDHIADFHYMDDQEFSEFRISKVEGHHKGYDRMQKILSQLNQPDAKPDAEEINLRFLSALPSSWFQVALTLKTKGGLEFLSFDDLYYKLKTLEVDIKGYKDVLHSFVADTKPEQQLAYEDLEQIDKLDLEEMDLKWKMAMLSVRVHKFEQKARRKIDFDKKESARREEGSKALVSVDTLVDWSNHDSECDEVIAAKEFGMIAGCDSTVAIKVGANKLYNMINGANSEEANTPGDAGEFSLMGVTSERVLQQNQLTLKDKIRVLSIELENTSNLLKYSEKINTDCEMAKKDLQTQLDNHFVQTEKWKTSSKNLYKLIDSSMSVRTKVGLGFTDYISQNELGWDESVFSVFTTTSKDVEGRPTFYRFAKTDSMKVVPPPLTGDYTSLSDYSDLDESQMSYGTKSSTTCDLKFMPNDSVSCDDSEKSSEDNTNDLASSDFGLKSSEHKSTDSSCASTSSVSTSVNKAEIDSNAKPVPTGTPKATPVPTGKPKGTPVPTGKPMVHPVPAGQPKFTPVPTGWLQRPFPVATDRGCSPSVPSELASPEQTATVPTGRYRVPTGRYRVPAGRYIVPTDRVIVPGGRGIVPAALDEGFSNKNYVRKFLRALHPKWRAKVKAIEESKDLTSLSFDTLIESSNSRSKDEEYAMAVRDFNKFFKKRGRECLKPPKDKNQRAFAGGSWSDSGEEDDKKAKDETCLIAQALASEIVKDGKVIGIGIRKRGLYVMKLGKKPEDKICLAMIDENSTLWHRRL